MCGATITYSVDLQTASTSSFSVPTATIAHTACVSVFRPMTRYRRQRPRGCCLTFAQHRLGSQSGELALCFFRAEVRRAHPAETQWRLLHLHCHRRVGLGRLEVFGIEVLGPVLSPTGAWKHRVEIFPSAKIVDLRISEKRRSTFKNHGTGRTPP